MRRLSPRRTAGRAGLSRIEVAVVLLCLLVAVAVLVPIVLDQRELQRDVACKDRLRKLSNSFAVCLKDRNDEYPWLIADEVSWTETLLPYLPDAEAYLESLQRGAVADVGQLWISEYLCPNGRVYDPGSNSYVANAGFGNFRVGLSTRIVDEPTPHALGYDLDGDGAISEDELELSRGTGLLWRAADAQRPVARNEIAGGDGAGYTLLMSENQRARGWRSSETFDLGFVVAWDRIELSEDAARPLNYRTADLGPFAINVVPVDAAARSPAPNSTHAGGVNVLFVDGRIQSLSEAIDPLVYLRLITWDGARWGEAVAGPEP